MYIVKFCLLAVVKIALVGKGEEVSHRQSNQTIIDESECHALSYFTVNLHLHAVSKP